MLAKLLSSAQSAHAWVAVSARLPDDVGVNVSPMLGSIVIVATGVLCLPQPRSEWCAQEPGGCRRH